MTFLVVVCIVAVVGLGFLVKSLIPRQTVSDRAESIPSDLVVEVSSAAVGHYVSAIVQDSTQFEIYVEIAPDVPWTMLRAKLPRLPNVSFSKGSQKIDSEHLKKLQDDGGEKFIRLLHISITRWEPNRVHLNLAWIASPFGQTYREYVLEKLGGRWVVTKDTIKGVV